ncbi:peptidoglycan-binding domain-containing protein [Streptomyces albipurpureus]|uniref:Peptidoglycan-binding protein n=1 Tax=Streptomyces albipurpureus TaxID=2897419 RepID=A0ABT0UVR1_9ACTN|nr:peptidoglycan-binding domain-containing protein [Streptomyces sp. CWNU-1]MCM2391271.1 peptidoglycan-binding protein [Streptomyces sp. CWNU-1]
MILRKLGVSLAVVTVMMTGITALATSPAAASAAMRSQPTAATSIPVPAVYCGYHGAVTPPTVRRGSSGNAVREAQCLLQHWGFDIGPSGVDGSFGARTEAAVRDIQGACGIGVDGIVGPVTWNVLRNGC